MRQDRWYVLDPPFLHELARDAIAASPDDTQGMIQHIITNLTTTFPQASNQIALNADSSEWVFNNAGGAMGAMYIIHASITEYLIIFGTPLGTEGHSGLHTADDYFHILVGEQWAFEPGALEMERYKAGDVHLLPRGTAKQYKMHEGCFAMEYARGMPLLHTVDTMTSFRVNFRLDSSYVAVRFCRHPHIDAGCSDALPHCAHHRPGDDQEPPHWKDLNVYS